MGYGGYFCLIESPLWGKFEWRIRCALEGNLKQIRGSGDRECSRVTPMGCDNTKGKKPMNQTTNLLRFFASFIAPMKIEERTGLVTPRLEVYLSKGRYLLDGPRVNYSFGGLATVFREAFSQFDVREREIANALILGFGAGSVASILREEYKKAVHLTGVEKDPVVIDLAKKYFQIERYEDLSLHLEDAGTFVARCDQQFDLIVVDVFVGAEVPQQFKQEKFLSELGRLLAPQGICFFNVAIYNEEVRTECQSLYREMESLVGKTEFCPISFGRTENWIFVCDRSKS
jgi:spermidine synthase